MTSKTTSLLIDPQPHSHIVYPSTDENRIAEAVGTFASAGLRRGDAVILVTTEARREAIEQRVTSENLDVKNLQNTGQLAFLDAGALLSAFLSDGMPDAALFKDVVGRIIDKASLNPDTGKPRRVRIFGEMVSLLYMASNVPAAERLEEFWNEIVESYSISLFCAYSLGANPAGECRLPKSLLDAHSHDLSTTTIQ